jgi:hypothetical protein
MIRSKKNLIAILLAAFVAGAIALIGVPLFKAEALTTDCFITWTEGGETHWRMTDPDDPWQLYPCGWYFGIWHGGQGGNEYSSLECACDHGENGFYVTFSVRDRNGNIKVNEQVMDNDAVQTDYCYGFPETHWCGVAHVGFGIFSFKYTCHYRDNNNVWQTHSTDWIWDYNEIESCGNPTPWASDGCDREN